MTSARKWPAGAAKLFGLEIGELPDAQKKELGLSTGVIVTDADGIAARAGPEAGDIILTINNQGVTDAQQFSAALKQADTKKPVLLLARRGDVSQYITLRPKACGARTTRSTTTNNQSCTWQRGRSGPPSRSGGI